MRTTGAEKGEADKAFPHPFAIYADNIMVGFIIYTAYYTTNRIARNLYASVGFRETGEILGNQVGMKLMIDNDNSGWIDFGRESEIGQTVWHR